MSAEPATKPKKHRAHLHFQHPAAGEFERAKRQNAVLGLAQKAAVAGALGFRSDSHRVCLEEKDQEYYYCFLWGSMKITFSKPAMTRSSISLSLVGETAHQQNDQLP